MAVGVEGLRDFFLDHPEVDGYSDFLLGNRVFLAQIICDPRLRVDVMERVVAEVDDIHILSELAFNPAVPVHVLAGLGKVALSGGHPKMGRVLLNPRMPEEILAEASSSHPFDVARNPSTPENVLYELHRDFLTTSAVHLAQNPNLPHKLAWSLYRKYEKSSVVISHLMAVTSHVDLLVEAFRSNELSPAHLPAVIRNPAFTKEAMLSVWECLGDISFGFITQRYFNDEEVLKRIYDDCAERRTTLMVRDLLRELPEYVGYPDEWFDEMFPLNFRSMF